MENAKKLHSLYVVEGRINTFKKNFKQPGPKCTPQLFAEAGFYSIATRQIPDLVKCFACRKELSDWEPDDDPWQEHVKRSKDCPYIVFAESEIKTLEESIRLFENIAVLNMNAETENLMEKIRTRFNDKAITISQH